jgi:thioredoxin reductase (NADPH)
MDGLAAAGRSDVIIVGAGPGGLTAALYLGRFRRPPLVIDGGQSRARWIPVAHNIPGFTEGIAGTQLLAQLGAQARRYGARFLAGSVSGISREAGAFSLTLGQRTLKSQFVILATGVKDQFPCLPGVEEAVLRSVVRFCPICDGFEATGRRIAVIGNGERGIHEAQFLLQSYSSEVSYLHFDDLNTACRQQLARLGIAVRRINPGELHVEGGALRVNSAAGACAAFDVIYSALGCVPQQQLAAALGAARDAGGALIVNAHQQTSVDGLYAAGDIVRGLDQVVVAAAEAAIAATDIHNRLRTS